MSKHVPCPADLITYVLDNEELDYIDHGRPIGHPYWLARKFGSQMAAAPEMLEALKVSLGIAKDYKVEAEFEGYEMAETAKTITKIERVIAKAEGREP